MVRELEKEDVRQELIGAQQQGPDAQTVLPGTMTEGVDHLEEPVGVLTTVQHGRGRTARLCRLDALGT